MIQIEFEIEAGTLKYLHDLFATYRREMDGSSFVPIPETLDDDPVMRSAWIEDLKASEDKDARTLEKVVFGSDQPGHLWLDDEEAEAVMRSCSVVRLEIHSRYLSHLPEEALERGEMDLEKLEGEGKRALGLYLFLGGLQAILLQHLLGEG